MFVAIYKSSNVEQVSLWSSIDAALEWRDHIAAANWQEWFTDPLPSYFIGSEYFWRMQDYVDGETFKVHELVADGKPSLQGGCTYTLTPGGALAAVVNPPVRTLDSSPTTCYTPSVYWRS